jgi:hypothetical protein
LVGAAATTIPTTPYASITTHMSSNDRIAVDVACFDRTSPTEYINIPTRAATAASRTQRDVGMKYSSVTIGL